MTPDEVLEASEGATVRLDKPENLSKSLVNLLTAPYHLADGSLGFQANFYFYDYQSLVTVNLELYSGDCGEVYQRLDTTYGPGIETDSQAYRIVKWYDRENCNVVSFLMIGFSVSDVDVTCSVKYRRFAAPGEAGGL